MIKAIRAGWLLLGLAGCASFADRSQPVLFTAADQVDAIEVSYKKRLEVAHTFDRRIVDRDKLDAFVRFINQRSSGWETIWGTIPGYEYHVRVHGRGEEIAWFAFSRGSIMGGRLGDDDGKPSRQWSRPRLRRLTADDWAELRAILELTSD